LTTWLDGRVGNKGFGTVEVLKYGKPGMFRVPIKRILMLVTAIVYTVIGYKFEPGNSFRIMQAVVYRILPKIFWPVFAVLNQVLQG